MKILKIKIDADNFEAVKPIFEKEGNKLLDTLNDKFKRNGLKCYFSIQGKIYYSDGYKLPLKFNAIGDKKGREWWQWINDLKNTETDNLIFKNESNPCICLKKTWRPESHRGQIPSMNQ